MGKKKAKRGSVRVQECNGTLRLIWSYQGKRYTISLGLKNIPWHQHLASKRALWMEREISYGRFDTDYIPRYRALLHGTGELADELPGTPIPPLQELWQQYAEAKQQGKSPSTVRQYQWVARHINRLPTDDLGQAQAILDAIAGLSPGTQKRLLTQFSACANWAMSSELIENNPFLGTAAAIKVPQRGTVENEIRPFTREERDRIIEAFQQSRYYQHYSSLVAFLFFTGARPSEVIPMLWRQVRAEHILFNQSRVYDGHGYQNKAGLKTQHSRRFPINSQLQTIIASIERRDADLLVFPSVEGTYINWSNFTRRAWKATLESLPEIEYREPYQMRHSFISYCREANISSIQIAEWVGNSVEMIDRVYARITQPCKVPNL